MQTKSTAPVGAPSQIGGYKKTAGLKDRRIGNAKNWTSSRPPATETSSCNATYPFNDNLRRKHAEMSMSLGGEATDDRNPFLVILFCPFRQIFRPILAKEEQPDSIVHVALREAITIKPNRGKFVFHRDGPLKLNQLALISLRVGN